MDPERYPDDLRRRSVYGFKLMFDQYLVIAEGPQDQQSDDLDRLHLELAKLTKPYGLQQVPLPKEVAVEYWQRLRVAGHDIGANASQLRSVSTLLTKFGAADSSFVRLLDDMIACE